MKRIANRSAISIFYYLLAIDGTVENEEKKSFSDICCKLDSQANEYLIPLLEECRKIIESANGDDYSEILQEAADRELQQLDPENGVPGRLMVWDMLVLAMSNGEYALEEKRFIRHIARVLEIPKDVLAEMEEMALTANAVMKEKAVYDKSEKPYCRIRPIVDELELRLSTIMSAASCLIEDEVEDDLVEENNGLIEELNNNDQVKAIADAVVNVGGQIGDFAADAANSVAENVNKLFGGFFGKKKTEKKDVTDEENQPKEGQ